MAGSISTDKASYNAGDTITITVTDPGRVKVETVTDTLADGTTVTANVTTVLPPKAPVYSGGPVTEVSAIDTPPTGVSVWSAVAA
jgi:hypothetical protein